jgi:hypothetical protein
MQSYVVSAAMRMSVSQLTPLLTSLAENAPDAHVILLVNEADSAKRERVRELNPNARLRCVSAPLIKMLLWLPPEKIRRTVVAPILSSCESGVESENQHRSSELAEHVHEQALVGTHL